MDFQFDATADGRRLKFLNVIDEHSRLCLAIRFGRRCRAEDVVAVLKELTNLKLAPAFIQSDKGPEFTAQAGIAARVAQKVATTSMGGMDSAFYFSKRNQVVSSLGAIGSLLQINP